jgi:hypothetical protein
MSFFRFLASGVLAASLLPSLFAQTQNSTKAGVRLFSFGATVSVLALPLIPNRDTQQEVSSTLFRASSTAGTQRRIGYGVTTQLALGSRFALNASLLRHRAEFDMVTNELSGTDIAATAVDERQRTTTIGTTRAWLYTVPVMLRYYNKDRFERGPRVFYGGGLNFRSARNIRTESTIDAPTGISESNTPLRASNRIARGFVVGLGAQFVDEIGIRIVPEVRYTRWINKTFDTFSSRSNPNQVEAMISITF